MTYMHSSLEKFCDEHRLQAEASKLGMSFVFEDGRVLEYAVAPNGHWSAESNFIRVKRAVEKHGLRGRLFSKDGDFIAYVPLSARSLDEVIIFADLQT